MLRALTRGMLPPLALRAWRRLRPPPRRFHGVFDAPDAVPSAPSPWDRDDYLAGAEARLRTVRAAERPDPDFLPAATLVASLLGAGPCRVLDFAGGTGLVYHEIAPWLRRAERLEWHVVDNPRLAEIGRRHLGPAEKVRFFGELPSAAERYDVVHVNTSLQYLEDPFAVVEKLCDYGAEWLLLTRLLAGEPPTFLTSQVVQGSRVPCWFLNFAELEERLGGLGFGLVYRSPVVEGDFTEWWAPSVPAERRVPCAQHALFRAGAGA